MANILSKIKAKIKIKKDMTQFNTVHYIVSMLKAYDIRHIVTSPGRQNSFFNSIIQNDDYFKCYSVVDERSAAYVATGIAFETGEPVVISCTGATASRNYLSALTEAYYRKLPIIALTFFDYNSNIFSMSPQFVDRSLSQKDIKNLSIELPRINDESDKKRLLTYLNAAFVTAKYKHEPVHIDSPSFFNYNLNSTELPCDIWTTKYYEYDFEYLKDELKNKKIGIYIGSHAKFHKNLETAISSFAESYDAVVFCDHTSNYHGKNKILITKASTSQIRKISPNIIIDLGHISGDYHSFRLFSCNNIWRISEDGNFKSRQNVPVRKFFNCSEFEFFRSLINDSSEKIEFHKTIKPISEQYEIPSLELSNPLVCYELSKRLPQNASLHLAILNSLRSMDCFELETGIDVNSNVGGFGIDGTLSSVIGQSLVSSERLHFCVVGDLAFFYDMNALGLKNIHKNLRIIVVNNNKGIEFKLNFEMQKLLGDNVDPFIAAAGHYKGGLKSWVESCGFKYIKAETKEEFLTNIDSFCSENFDKPVVFEITTTDNAEQDCFKKMLKHNK